MKIENKLIEYGKSGDSCLPHKIFLNISKEVEYTVIYQPYPTNNCQICSLSAIQDFLKRSTKEEKLELFKYIRERLTRPCVMLDLNKRYVEFIDFIPREYFILYNEYTNSNGNEMVLCIINLIKLFKS